MKLISCVPDTICDLLQINCYWSSLAINYAYMTVPLRELLWVEGILTAIIRGRQERRRGVRMWRKSNRIISISIYPIAWHCECMTGRESLRCASIL